MTKYNIKHCASRLAIAALSLICTQVKASDEGLRLGDVITYAAITSIRVNDPLGEMYINTHDDGTQNIYLHQELIGQDSSGIEIENQDRDGQLYTQVTYNPTGRNSSGNVVRGVRAQPGSTAHGIVASGRNVRGNVVEDVQASDGGSAYGIVSSGSANISGNVVSGVRSGSGGGGAYGIVIGGGSRGNVSGNVVSGISGAGAHGIVIGGRPQRSPQQLSGPHVRHTILVPEGREISYELIAAAGLIKTDGAMGSMNTNNQTGNSTFENHVGSIDARSTTGNIDILSYQAGAVVTLGTTTGRLNSPLVQANAQAQRGRRRPRRVRSINNKQVGDGKYKIDARTTTGNVTFTYE